MDGGIDDALALILAFRSPELEVVGITAVSGNVPVDLATINGLRVVELLDLEDAWVAKGLANPLIRDPIRATSFHGRDGLGDSNLPPPKLKPKEKNALEMLTEELATTKKQGLSIICTGPLTNIAALLTGSPEVAKKIGQLMIMGGAYGLTKYGYGNETPAAEFNILSDPEAARIVFESGVALRAVGLDVTMIPGSQLTLEDYRAIRRRKTKVTRFAVRILEKTMRRRRTFALHDPMAVAAMVRPSIFNFAPYQVLVEIKGEFTTGMTIVDRRASQHHRRSRHTSLVCDSVRSEDFKSLFLNRLVEA